MSTPIKQAARWLHARPKVKEWLWFIGLWCAGLCTVVTATYPIKWLIGRMG